MFSNNLLMAAAGGGDAGYVLEGSALIDVADSASIERLPGTAGNRKKWIIGACVKISPGVSCHLAGAFRTAGGNNFLTLQIAATGALQMRAQNLSVYDLNLQSTARYRDGAAYYDVIGVFDSTPAVPDGDDCFVYVNGVKVTAWSTETYPSQNDELEWGNNVAGDDGSNMYFGQDGAPNYGTGYFVRAFYQDGIAFSSIDDYGEFDTNGNWQLKDLSELTFGDEGVLFKDAADFIAGTDTSGNSNTFTKVGTITATNDSPTNDADNDYGNYPVLSPTAKNSNQTLSEGNLKATGTGSWGLATATIDLPENGAGIYAVQVEFNGSNHTIGVMDLSSDSNFVAATGELAVGYYPHDTGIFRKFEDASTESTPPDVPDDTQFEILFDLDNDLFGIKYSDTEYWSSYSIAGMRTIFSQNYSDTAILDFGQGDYTPTDASYKLLSTATLPTPTIPDPTEHIFVGLMTHNGTTGSVTGINFDCTTYDYQVELKFDGTESWWITDSLMDGESGNWFPWDDATKALQAGASLISSVTSTSMTFGAALTSGTYMVVIRKAGLQAGRTTNAESGSGDGSRNACTYSVNTTAGFSIMQVTGHGGANIAAGEHTLAAHGLGGTIDLYQMFNQTTAAGRPVMPGHRYNGGVFSTDNYVLMDNVAAKSGSLNVMPSFPDSSDLYLGDNDLVNKDGDIFTIYAHKAVTSYSYFSWHIGNANADGPVGNMGASTSAYLFKQLATGTGSWRYAIFESDDTNPGSSRASTDSNAGFGDLQADVYSNGYKVRQTSSDINGDTDTILACMWGGRPIQGPAPASNTSQGRAR